MEIKKIVTMGSVALLTATALQAKEKINPNVLVILLDDAGYNDFGFMGSKDIKTPEIDRLCSQGVRFTDAHVSASVSGPSRAGILSGRYQQRFGYECNLGNSGGLSLDETTIADVFKQRGYATACIGKWHQGNGPAYHPNKRGFDHFYGFISGHRSYFYNPKGSDKPGSTQNLQLNGKQKAFDGYLTDVLADDASLFIANNDKPFFMYLAFNAVHTPMQATQQDLERFRGHPRQMLAAMTWALDRAIGKVVAELEKTGKMDNTLIFFLSDNGGAYNNQSSNYPLKGNKGYKFEGGMRVPFFMVWKKQVKENRTFEGLTSSLDIFATAVTAAGFDVNTLVNKLDGVNLLPYLQEDIKKAPHDKLFWRKDQMAAARVGQYKLIRANGAGERVYDLFSDLGETVDLQDEKKEVYEQLRKELSFWEEGMIKPLWTEGVKWDTVVREAHRDLMNNREVRYNNPSKLPADLLKH